MRKSKAETIAYRLAKARQDQADAGTLSTVGSWNGAVNRLYYAAFHAVSALLLQQDIVVKSHVGAKGLFELHFIKTGRIDRKWSKFYTRLFENRNDSDYEDFAVFTADDVLPLIPETDELIGLINALIQEN
ncbi:UPF0332 protein [Fibrella aestuarina BUZ 2]|uniref:UPF0332 protein n=1 Tax=Fibrella aestuarina BUZ 2 TaxID=1166018 RepID=I0K4Y8_9BACT|nr:HEPN domain-containing protein [Fibrella aestuarina]CCG99191.1 UPF0332 protein [Fibrella aestuarina BUZ 2]